MYVALIFIISVKNECYRSFKFFALLAAAEVTVELYIICMDDFFHNHGCYVIMIPKFICNRAYSSITGRMSNFVIANELSF